MASKADIKNEGIQEGITKGETLHLISQIKKKCKKGKDLTKIADELETDESTIDPIYDLIKKHQDYGKEKIYEMLQKDKIKENEPTDKQLSMRVDPEDQKMFDSCAKNQGITKKKLFHKMVDLWQHASNDNGNNRPLVFRTYINNNFNKDEQKKEKAFAISGSHLCGFVDIQKTIECSRDDLYYLSLFNPKYNADMSETFTREEICNWCKAINKEFNINLDIDRDLHQSIYIPEFKYTLGLNMYWDFNRKRYLLEDIFELYKQEKGEINNWLNTRRYRYIDNVDELEEIFKNDRYILFNPGNKKEFYYQYFKKEIIPPEQLEEELEKYYK